MSDPLNGQPQQTATPRTALEHMRRSQSPTEAAEVAQFNLLMPSDKMEMLYRLCIKLGDYIARHDKQFPLIDLACEDFAEAIEDLRKRMEVTK